MLKSLAKLRKDFGKTKKIKKNQIDYKKHGSRDSKMEIHLGV